MGKCGQALGGRRMLESGRSDFRALRGLNLDEDGGIERKGQIRELFGDSVLEDFYRMWKDPQRGSEGHL